MNLLDITHLAAFLKASSGLIIAEDKAYLVESRLAPVAAKHGLPAVSELLEQLKRFPSSEMKRDIVEAMTTNETSFFRDGTPFEILKARVLPDLVKNHGTKKVRLWCAATSTGQEPYSIGILVRELQAQGIALNIEIVATDIDSNVLRKAETGVYSRFEVQRGLPVNYLIKYFDKDGADGWKVKADVRSLVTFQKANLLERTVGMGIFNIIFCRNVLIYFDPPTKANVLEQLASHLTTEGFLFLGGAETVLSITDRFDLIPGLRGVYMPVKKQLAA